AWRRIRGTPPRSNGRRPHLRDTATSSPSRSSTASRTSTACRGRATTIRRSSRRRAEMTETVIPYMVKPHPVTGIPNGKFGIWLFLASEVMLFGALFSSYVLIRTGAPHWPPEGGLSSEILNVPLATLNTAVLITSSITMVLAWASCKMQNIGRFKLWMGLTIALSFVFLVVKYFEYTHKFHDGHFPSTNNFYAVY